MRNKENNSIPNTDVEQLNPSLMGETADIENDEIISNMTYSDYLSAVYSCEEKARKKALFDKKMPVLKKVLDEKKAVFQKLKNKEEANRKERERLHTAAINEQKQKWQKTQDRLDVRISQEVGRAKQQAEAEISKRKDEFEKEFKTHRDRIRYLKDEMSRLDSDYNELLEKQESLEDYSGDSFPVADESTFELLQTAKNKRWLTSYHRELLRKNVNEICSKRIHSFDELKDRELEFANSKMVKDIRKGEVTNVVIREFTKLSTIIFAVVFSLLSLVAFVNPMLLFFAVIQAALSCLGMGYAVLLLADFLGQKYLFDPDETSVEERSLLIAALVLGGIGGFFLWEYLIFDTKNLFAFLYTILSVAASSLLFRKLMLTELASKLLKKIPFLKNRARYYIFKNSVKSENGKYNLQIYCYLNHSEVLQYLSINYKNQISVDLENKKELNRNIYKKNQSELSELSEQKKELDIKEQKLRTFIKHRKLRLQEEIKQIESERDKLKAIDFEANIPQKTLKELERLDSEYNALQTDISEAKEQARTTQEKFDVINRKYKKLSKEYLLIEAALRYWYKTPTPAATDYRLLDSLCFESNRQLSIIHHKLRPYAFRYTVRHKESSPSKSLKSTIFRYIRGLIKINPCRMLQINIIDPVSDPSILINDPLFKRINSMGIINGVSSPNDFEIRLFSSQRNYNTFRSVFKTQCTELHRLLSKSPEVTDDKPFSVELGNRIKANENEPFMYQIMMFIVPRAFDRTDFDPPSEIVKAIENGTYLNMGLLPIFFVDNDSIHENWKNIVGMCPESCLVNQGKDNKQ